MRHLRDMTDIAIYLVSTYICIWTIEALRRELRRETRDAHIIVCYLLTILSSVGVFAMLYYWVSGDMTIAFTPD